MTTLTKDHTVRKKINGPEDAKYFSPEGGIFFLAPLFYDQSFPLLQLGQKELIH